jgi:hypothetical protein
VGFVGWGLDEVGLYCGETTKGPNQMKRIILNAVIVASAWIANCSTATLLLTDSFNTNGALVGTTPGSGSGNWTNNTGTSGSLLVASNKLVIQDDSTEDAYSAFSAAQSGDVYAAFTLNLASSDLPSTAGTYFASFMNGTNYVGRLFSDTTSAASGKFRLGVAGTSTAFTTNWGSDLSADVDYVIIMKFTQNGSNDAVTLWINPTDSSSTSITSTAGAFSTTVSGFGFRQAASSGDLAIDNLVVATTFSEALVAVPEPHEFALAIVGLLGLVAVGHKRKMLS